MYADELGVRAAKPEDIDEIVRLCAAHAEYERAAYEPEGKRAALETFLFGPQPRLFCLVVGRGQGGGLAGYASWSMEASTWSAALYAHMDCLYLDPDARGRGIGRALMERIAYEALKHDAVELQWQTPAFNADAIRFYERLGTSRKDKIRFFLDGDAMRRLAGTTQDSGRE